MGKLNLVLINLLRRVNNSKPLVLMAKGLGLPEQKFKNFNQAVFDELELKGAGLLEILAPISIVANTMDHQLEGMELHLAFAERLRDLLPVGSTRWAFMSVRITELRIAIESLGGGVQKVTGELDPITSEELAGLIEGVYVEKEINGIIARFCEEDWEDLRQMDPIVCEKMRKRLFWAC